MKKKLLTTTFCVAISANCMISTAFAATVSLTTADGNGADTFIRSTLSGNNAANQNYGSSDSVLIKNDIALPGNNRKGYLRFDLSSITDSISDAELMLTYVDTNTDTGANPGIYNVYGLLDGHSAENWGENLITWNNAPGNNTASTGGVIAAETTLLGTFSLDVTSSVPGDQVSFSSSALVAFLLADTNDLATVLLTRQQQNFSVELFASKENATWAAPTLKLDLNPVPVPAAVWLFGTALIGFVGMSRRRKVA